MGCFLGSLNEIGNRPKLVVSGKHPIHHPWVFIRHGSLCLVESTPFGLAREFVLLPMGFQPLDPPTEIGSLQL